MKFKLICDVTVSMYTIVDADNIDQAKKIADRDRDVMRLIHDGSNDPEQEWILDEIDGMPVNIRAGYKDKNKN